MIGCYFLFCFILLLLKFLESYYAALMERMICEDNTVIRNYLVNCLLVSTFTFVSFEQLFIYMCMLGKRHCRYNDQYIYICVYASVIRNPKCVWFSLWFSMVL